MAQFGMGGYVGSAEDQRRILHQQKEREEQRRQYEEAKKKAEATATAPALRQFGTSSSVEQLEQAFKTETVGLVTRDEFVKKRETIKERMEAEVKRQREATEDALWHQRDQLKAKRSRKAAQKSKLSFADDDDDEEEEEEEEEGEGGEQEGSERQQKKEGKGKPRKFATLGKDPTVRADFLPDRDREREEEALREQLKREWSERQEAIKNEPLEITYSYWNGSGHRKTITVKKGDTISTFLKLVQEQLAPHFRELRAVSSSSLMYIKEDMILPQTLTFYELIVSKAQGRSGPLFQFDVQEVAAATFDPRLKSQDTHAGKVVERHWYSKNKHIFPYNRWEVYDPDAKKEKEGTAEGGGGGKR